MKKISLIVVTLFLAAGFVTTSAEEVSLNTVIPSVDTDTCSVAAYTIDPALQTEVVLDPYVQSSINECFGTTGAVTMQQLQNLEYITLNFSGATTASLSGLENATNLEYIFITSYDGTIPLDLAPLANANIIAMYNEYSNLTNYGSLEGISEIIIDNGVMNDMILEDIATIESLNYLEAYGQSDVTTVAPLLALENLYYVSIYDWTNITDVESLYALEEQLAGNEGFVDYNEIYYQVVEDGTIVPATSNEFCETNEYIYNTTDEIVRMDSDFADYLAYTCFSENLVPQFEDLVLTIHQLQSITYIDASVYFEELGMEIEDVDNDLSILSYATNLETLIVDGMGDVDLSFIANNPKLMEISAMDTNISDFSPIASSTSLTTLDLTNANISNSDLEIIAQNDTIETLYLDDNKELTNIDALYEMDSLTTVTLEGTGVSESDIADLEAFLTTGDVVVEEEEEVTPVNTSTNTNTNTTPTTTTGVEQNKTLKDTGEESYVMLFASLTTLLVTLFIVRKQITK